MAIQNTTDEFVPAVDEFSIENTTDVDARPLAADSTAVKSGWGAGDEMTMKSKEFPTELKLGEEFQVIKFLDQDGPFAIYKQHFLQQKTEGKRSYVCLGNGCPLCVTLSHKPESKHAFTVAVITGDVAVRQMLIATPRLYKTLHAAHFSPQGPLTKNYWAISRTGKMQQTVYSLNSIKGRDLNEDWGIDEAKVETLITTLEPFPRSAIYENSHSELADIAKDLA
jgi:hypothetical protein